MRVREKPRDQRVLASTEAATMPASRERTARHAMKNIFFASISSLLLVSACSKPDASANQEAAATATAPADQAKPADAAAHAGHDAAATGAFVAAPEGAKVHFESPVEGSKIEGPATDGKVKVAVKMAVENMEVKPAGELVAATGHHHIIVDGAGVEAGQTVPADATHIHFGKGQTETELELTPGEHTLTLQFADGAHRSYGPALTQTIHIVVAEKT